MQKLEDKVIITHMKYAEDVMRKVNYYSWTNNHAMANYYMGRLMNVNDSLKQGFRIKYVHDKISGTYHHEVLYNGTQKEEAVIIQEKKRQE